MAAQKYSKVTTDGKVQYQLNGADVDGKEVPVATRNALAQQPDGYVADELGDKFDPSVDTDESEDEDLGTTPPATPPADDPAADGSEQDPEETDEGDDGDPNDQPVPAPNKPAEKPAAKPRARRAPTPPADENAGAPQDEEGMGFKRANGKTLSIFSNKPHETVKNVAGVMVPLTVDEYNTKSDGEIIEKLQALGKL